MTHHEFSLQQNPTTPCTAHDITFGNRCMNCGFDPNTSKQVPFAELAAEFPALADESLRPVKTPHSPLPWRLSPKSEHRQFESIVGKFNDTVCIAEISRLERFAADAALIVEAVNSHASLVAELAAVRAERDRLRAQLDAAQADVVTLTAALRGKGE